MDEIVTSFGTNGYRLYGRRFIETFSKHWPSDVQLTVYFENELPDCVGDTPANVVYRDLFEYGEMCQFLNENNDDIAKGRWPMEGKVWKPKAIKAGYNFKFDAYKFARKPFAIYHAITHTNANAIHWLDADIVTLQPVPQTLLHETLPRDYDISRLHRPGYHSECGYIGITVCHDTVAFYKEFKNLYLDGRYLTLKEWHDSFVFDVLLRNNPNFNVYDIPHQSKRHPFVNSILGEYMDHLKGVERKRRGKSFKGDIVQ